MIAAALAAALFAQLAAAPASSPLLELAGRLRCAADEGAARAELSRLRTARSAALELPDENLEQGGTPSVRAGTMDVVLAELHAVAAHFPGLRAEAAALLTSWNACGLGAWDLVARESGVQRTPAARPFPLGGAGLRAAGLAVTSEPSPLLAALSPAEQAEARARCWGVPAEPRAPGTAAADATPRPPARYAPSCPEPAPAVAGVALAGGFFTAAQTAADAPPPAPVYGQGPQPSAPAPVPGAVPAGPGIALQPYNPGSRLSFSAYVAWMLAGRYEAGGAVLYQPFSYFFARAGAGYRVGLDHAPYYSWGFGYDDWHPGTFSLQINDFGPTLIPGGGLGLRQAIVDLGYKLHPRCQGRLCLSTYVSIDAPLDGIPYAGGILTLTFRESWFVRAGTYALLNGRGVRFLYGFGRFDFHSGSINLSYDNWGPNLLPEIGFRQNGVVTLSINGAL